MGKTVAPYFVVHKLFVVINCFTEKHLYPARQALKKGNKKGQLTGIS